MPSETDLANVALRLIGANRITSFTDGSKNANAVQDVYSGLRDDMLRSHRWNFATQRQKLARSSTAPTYEFDYAYALPSDWLRTVAVHDSDAGTGTFLYREELVANQRCFVTSVEQVYLTYVARITDPNLMSDDFIRALEFSLARDLAVPLANSNSLTESMGKQAERALARARSVDAAGSFPRQRPRGSWATSRGGYPYNSSWERW